MSDEDSNAELNRLVEEFSQRRLSGQAPSVQEYIQRYPHLAEEIRDLFPMIELLEHARGDGSSSTENRSLQSAPQGVGPGTQLGDYFLGNVIGRGGMGIVYEAQHAVLGSRVAIKLLPSSSNQDHRRERFLREASAAARMNHPNIVRVFDFGSVGENLYFAMSLIDGCGLDRLLSDGTDGDSNAEHELRRQFRRLSSTSRVFGSTIEVNGVEESESSDADSSTPTDAAQNDSAVSVPSNAMQGHSLWKWAALVASDLADALAYAHDRGIIHRDIKPSNLLLDRNGHVFVTDFGLAKVSDNHELTGSADILGTLRYLSPEALNGTVDARSDVYALGLAVYELVAGRPALQPSDRGHLIKDIATGNIPRLRQLVPRIPTDLERVIHKAIETDPAARYASAGEMRDDFRCFLTGQPVAARSTSILYRSSRWLSRNRTVSALATILFLVLTAATSVAIVTASQFRDLAQEKETQRLAAVESRNQSQSSEARAQRSLLQSLISDAEGWSLRSQIGRREKGLQQLRRAIELAQQTNDWKGNRHRINQIASRLITLDDAMVTNQWTHDSDLSSIEGIAFRSDLTQYAWCDLQTDPLQLQFFDIAEGRSARSKSIELPRHVDPNGLTYSPGNHFVAGIFMDLTLFFVDLRTERIFTTDHRLSESSGFEFHSDETAITLLTDEGKLITISLDDSSTLHEIQLDTELGFNAVAISPDATSVVVYTNNRDHRSSALGIYQFAAEQLVDLGTTDAFQRVRWHPDGRRLAIMGSRVSIHEIENNRTIQQIDVWHGYPSDVHWIADGKMLATTGEDRQTRFLRASIGREVARAAKKLQAVSDDGMSVILRSGSQFQQVRMQPNEAVVEFSIEARRNFSSAVIAGRFVLASFHGGMNVADLATEQVLSKEGPNTHGVVLAANGNSALVDTDRGLLQIPIRETSGNVASTSTIQVGPISEVMIEVVGENHGWKPAGPYTVSVDHSGRWIGITPVNNGSNCLALIDQQKMTGVYVHSSTIADRCHSNPDGRFLVTSTITAPGVNVIDAASDTNVFYRPIFPCYANFSPDGQRLILSELGRLVAYDVDNWQQVRATRRELTVKAGATFAISPDNDVIAVETQDPRGVQFLDCNTFEPLLLLPGRTLDPDSQVMCSSFDAKGNWLVSKRGNQNIGCWNLAKLRTEFAALGVPWPLGDLGLGDPEIPIRSIDIDLSVTGQRVNIKLVGPVTTTGE